MSNPGESGQRTHSEPPQSFPSTYVARHTQSEPITSRILGRVDRTSLRDLYRGENGVVGLEGAGGAELEQVQKLTDPQPQLFGSQVGELQSHWNGTQDTESGDNPYFPPTRYGGGGFNAGGVPPIPTNGLSHQLAGADEGRRGSPSFLRLNDLEANLPTSFVNYSNPVGPPPRQPSQSYDPWLSRPSPIRNGPPLLTPGHLYPLMSPAPSDASGVTSPLYNYSNEHLWSRAYQEQHLQLQQKQAWQTLQLRLQQQDEWYQQDQYQRMHHQQRLRNRYPSHEGTSSPLSQNFSTPPHPYVLGPIPDSSSDIDEGLPRLPPLREEYFPPILPSTSLANQPLSFQPSTNPFRPPPDPNFDGYGQRMTLFDQGGQVVAQSTSTLSLAQNSPGRRTSTDSGRPSSASWRSPSPPPLASRPPPPQPSPDRFPRNRTSSNNLYTPREFQQQRQAVPLRAGYPTVPPPTGISPRQSLSLLSNQSPSTSILSSDLLPEQSLPPFLRKASEAEDSLKSGLPVVPNRSPFALWAGNIPSDVSHEQLWEFFMSRSPPPDITPRASFVGDSGTEQTSNVSTPGVASIHLIARSKCAFINYISEAHLLHAMAVSDGVSLRPLDKRCKPLVCRVRLTSADAKSGVGAQRGERMHRNYLKSLKQGTGVVVELERHGKEGSDDSGSTTSSALEREFPKRFFILKSHNSAELVRSVNSGLWSTQIHNEAVLDQAFRTAEEVFLIFSANGSGEWFGYAKMAGPVPHLSSHKRTSLVESSPTRSVSPSNTISLVGSEDVSTASQFMLRIPTNIDSSIPNSPGREFPLQWIKVKSLPFARTRHIQNPFNSGREIKICRDGTEIEPIAGAKLLDEFTRFDLPRPGRASPIQQLVRH